MTRWAPRVCQNHASQLLQQYILSPPDLQRYTSNLVFTTVTGSRVIPAIVLAHAPNATDSPTVLSSL